MIDRWLDRSGGRDRVIHILTAAVVVGVVVWIIAEAAFYIAIFGFGDGGYTSSWIRWAQVVSRLANDVWLGALGLLFLLWLVTSSAVPSSSPAEHGTRDHDADPPVR